MKRFVSIIAITLLALSMGILPIGCSSLTSIKFNGTKAQWKAIRKAGQWNGNTINYTVSCTDGTLSKSES